MNLFYFAGFDLGTCVSGARSHVEGITTGLCEQGWEVTLFSCCNKGSSDQPELPFRHILIKRPGVRWPSQIIDQMKMAWKLLLWKTPKPDVIYIRSRFTMIVPVVYALVNKVPYFYEINALKELETSYSGLLKVGIKIENWILKHASGVFLVTEELSSHFIRRTGLPEARFLTVPNACRRGLCIGDEHIQSMQEGKAPTIGFVGAFQPRQGVEMLLEEITPIIKEKVPNISVVIGGGGPNDGKYRKIVEHQGLSSCVEFAGYVDNSKLPAFMRSVDVAVAPYIGALRRVPMGSPLKLYTYLACGKMVVTSDLPSLESFRQCPAVRFAKADDPEDFARVILEVLQVSPEQRADLGRQGREYIAANHTWEHRAKQTSEFILKRCNLLES